MQAIIYIRVSTIDQATHGLSLQAQEDKARSWAEYNGCDVKAVHTDAGLSGRRADNRPALKEALNELEQGDVLVVYSLSRLARSTQDAITIAAQIEKQGSNLVSLTEQIDTTTPMGEFFFTVIAGLAQLESKIIGERVSLGMQQKKAKGGFTGGKRSPYGYQRGEDGSTLEPVEAEQKVIELVKQFRSEGLTLRAISTELENAGILSRSGKPFAATQVSRIAQAA